MKGYPIGTKIQEKHGRVKVKIVGDDGKPKWEAEARRLWELYHGKLVSGDRVFLAKGVGSKIEKANLVKVHFRTEPWKVLDHSRIVYQPKRPSLDKGLTKTWVNL